MLPFKFQRSRIIQQIKFHRWYFIFTTSILIAKALLAVVLPMPVKYVVDKVLVDSSGIDSSSALNLILLAAGALLLLTLVSAVLDFSEEYFVSQSATRVVNGLRRDLVALLMTRKLPYIEKQKKIDLLGKISSDTANVEFIVTAMMTTLLGAVPTLIFILWTMYAVDYRFALIVSLVLPFMYVATVKLSHSVQHYFKLYRRESVRFESDLHQSLTAMPLVKSLSMETVVTDQINSSIDRTAEHLRRSRVNQGLMEATLTGGKNGMRISILIAGGMAVANKMITLGELVLFLSYIEVLGKQVNEMSKLSRVYAKARASVERVEGLFQEMLPEQEQEGVDLLTLNDGESTRPPATLVFDKISFSYEAKVQKSNSAASSSKTSPHTVQHIVNDFSASFSGGDFVVAVGESGLGKSTLLRLLNRLIDPTAGEVRLNGRNIEEIQLKSLRDYICYIAQENFLLHSSVAENLSLADTDRVISEDEMRTALAAVNAEKFVEEMSDGIATVIGESGQTVSGGQAKRINLARAFLRSKSQIYIFDEPTSGLDPQSSLVVLESAKRLADVGKLVFWITHKLEEIRPHSKVLFFYPGKNPECKLHEELFHGSTEYKKFHLPEVAHA